MAEENIKREEAKTNKGGSASRSSGNKNRNRNLNRSISDSANNSGTGSNGAEQTKDTFQEYKDALEKSEIPAAVSDLDIKKETFDVQMERRRNQMTHLKNLEENQQVYHAISFNLSSIVGKNAEEVNTNIQGFVTKNKDLKDKLVIAREAIKQMKQKLAKLEESARRIDDAKDDSAHSEQTKLLRKGVNDQDGQKGFDEALSEIVEKTDESNNLADDTREKEIITEGIAAYVDADSLTLLGTSIKTTAELFKKDIDTNVTEATTDVQTEKSIFVTLLAELSTADMAKDRSELQLNSLQETSEYLDNIVAPEEDTRSILAEIEQTYEPYEEEGA